VRGGPHLRRHQERINIEKIGGTAARRSSLKEDQRSQYEGQKQQNAGVGTEGNRCRWLSTHIRGQSEETDRSSDKSASGGKLRKERAKKEYPGSANASSRRSRLKNHRQTTNLC